MIELRSDTFTLPTPQMLEAIIQAPLGDDVYAEDPTVRELEALAAQKVGKEAACLMPSGTMANLASLLAHCPRGSKILVGNEADLFIYEAGGASICGGLIYEAIPTQPDGTLTLDDLAAAIPVDKNDAQFALPALICIENTHNRCGGLALPLDYLQKLAEFAHAHNLPVHMDGARLFNAAVALQVHPATIAQYVDSLQFCLSKGLSAPIGSMVVGDATWIERVRRIRKMLGGGMRQAGIIAAAGIVALEQMVDRLADDHLHASLLAEGLARQEGLELVCGRIQTNIVLFRVTDERFTWQTFIAALHERGVAIGELGHANIRAVTHRGITRRQIGEALAIIAQVLER